MGTDLSDLANCGSKEMPCIAIGNVGFNNKKHLDIKMNVKIQNMVGITLSIYFFTKFLYLIYNSADLNTILVQVVQG
jgi:hypothetical protein